MDGCGSICGEELKKADDEYVSVYVCVCLCEGFLFALF